MRDPAVPTRLTASTCLLAVLLVATLTSAAAAAGAVQGDWTEETMLEAVFDVRDGAALRIDVHDADVVLRNATATRVAVRVTLHARDQERARAHYERLNFRADGDRDEVRIESDAVRWDWNSWRDGGGMSVTVHVEMPERMNVDLRTDDGDIGVERIVGDVRLISEDGDIVADALEGDAEVETEDGDIRVRTANGGTIVLHTSDGDLNLGEIRGSRISIRTSDGDIRSDRLVADDLEVETSDGDIALDAVAGGIGASSGDGSIRVRFEQFGPSTLQSGDGDIVVGLPAAAGAELDLHGEDLSFRSDGAFDGEVTRRRIQGSLNGGGPLLRATTRGGTVRLRLR